MLMRRFSQRCTCFLLLVLILIPAGRLDDVQEHRKAVPEPTLSEKELLWRELGGRVMDGKGPGGFEDLSQLLGDKVRRTAAHRTSLRASLVTWGGLDTRPERRGLGTRG